MLKKIAIDRLRAGMYVQKMCGSWLDHPFWRKSFLVPDAAMLAQLKATPVREVVIDTGRGLDVEDDAPVEIVDSAEPEPEPEAPQAIQAPAVLRNSTPLAQEMRHAARICSNAKAQVESMFQEARMGKAIDAERALPLVEEIASSVLRNPGALISMARLKQKDGYTYMHSVAVCALMVSLSNELGLGDGEKREAGLGGLLHDLGKTAIPLDVLNKPGRLTDDEYLTVKDHPEAGHRMLLEGGSVGEIPLDICLHHHEKIDGSGYPHKLSGDRITLYARMGAVCDVYDAITSNRPYKHGWDPAESLGKMAAWSGHFDEAIFQAFVKSVGIYPIGSLVRLKSGRLGIIIGQGEDSLLEPTVTVFFSTKSSAHIRPEILDLSRKKGGDEIACRESPAKWGFGDLSHFWVGDTMRVAA
jgi:HD-GYP domain-containing protein (c-di-GMP phosphodiesterase class II)